MVFKSQEVLGLLLLYFFALELKALVVSYNSAPPFVIGLNFPFSSGWALLGWPARWLQRRGPCGRVSPGGNIHRGLHPSVRQERQP